MNVDFFFWQKYVYVEEKSMSLMKEGFKVNRKHSVLE